METFIVSLVMSFFSMTQVKPYVLAYNSTVAVFRHYQALFTKPAPKSFMQLAEETSRETGISVDILCRIAYHESRMGSGDWSAKTNNYFGLTHWAKGFAPKPITKFVTAFDGVPYCVFDTPKDGFICVANLLKARGVTSLDDLTFYNPGDPNYISKLKSIKY